MRCSDAPGADFPVAGLVLAPMDEDDLDQVLAIEDEAFGSPWRREHFRFEIEENVHAVSLVVRRGSAVVAYACVWRLDEELKINNLAVHRAERGHGVGRALLRRVLADAADAGCTVARLEVRPSNAVARGLYSSEGFVEIGRRKNYYAQEGEDAIVMERELV